MGCHIVWQNCDQPLTTLLFPLLSVFSERELHWDQPVDEGKVIGNFLPCTERDSYPGILQMVGDSGQ